MFKTAHLFATYVGLGFLLWRDHISSSSISCTQAGTPEAQSSRELRMFAFVVCLRLLRINIQHLVGWKIDPTEVRAGGS